jgi:HSP20 family molecular chaperone IbpA
MLVVETTYRMSLFAPTEALTDAVGLSDRLLTRSAPAGATVTAESTGYVMEIGLPGAERAETDIEWRRGTLTVRATIDGERVYDETCRFPSVVDGDRITSATRADTLTVRLPVPRQAASETGAPAD